MQLRCLAGAYAGEIRDYAFAAGQAALATGMAERLDAAQSGQQMVRQVPVAVTSKRKNGASPRAR